MYIIMLLILLLLSLCIALCKKHEVVHYSDGFEIIADSSSWTLFEEIVGGSTCYCSSCGSIAAESRAAQSGSFGLEVWSNNRSGHFSNHIIAGRSIIGVPQDSNKMTYTLHSYLPTSSIFSTQVGPEFSIQNTRVDSNQVSKTSIAGIQYIASPYILNKWNIWMEISPGVAAWRPLDWEGTYAVIKTLANKKLVAKEKKRSLNVKLPNLNADIWYQMRLEVDFELNKYTSLTVSYTQQAKNHKKKTFSYEIDLRNISIAFEDRGFEKSTVITLEGENLWNNCGDAGNSTSQVYFDDIELSSVRVDQ